MPLDFCDVRTPVHEAVQELLDTSQAPVYIVHFSQREAVSQAQALQPIALVNKEQKAKIAAALGSFTFGPGFGQILSKLLRAGIGVHHAGLLPRYRRLVERLTQAGLLQVICGTDTLGVGINVPIPVPVAYFSFTGSRASKLGDLGPNGKQAVQFWTQTKTVTARWYEDHGSSSDKVNTTISMR